MQTSRNINVVCSAAPNSLMSTYYKGAGDTTPLIDMYQHDHVLENPDTY